MAHRDIMLRSGRVAGAVGTKPTVVTKFVIEQFPETIPILDFGAGKFRQQSIILEAEGYGVQSFDLEENMELYPPSAMIRGNIMKPVCMLSNVLNVQENTGAILDLVDRIFDVFNPMVIVANYPKSPRYPVPNRKELIEILGRTKSVMEFERTRAFLIWKE